MGDIVDFLSIRASNRLDAEFFSPSFLKIYNKLKNKNHTRLHDLCEFIRSGPAGSVLRSSLYVFSGIKMYRPSNLNNWTCENGSIVYVSREYCRERKLLVCHYGDVLAARVGDIKLGIVQNDNSTISPNLIVIRTKKGLLDPYFLLAFLNHEDGFAQIQRGSKRVSLASVTTSHLEEILVPQVLFSTQRKIGSLIKKALESEEKGKMFYKKAQVLLMRTIKFKSFKENRSAKVFYLSNLHQMKRADAEFFIFKQENKDQIKTVILGQIAKISRGIEPGRSEYKASGKLFLRASNIDKFGLIDKSQKFISSKLYEKLSKKYQPRVGEILFVKDGKPGVACLIREPLTGIISESIVRIILDQSVSPEYVFLCINSPFCQQQILIDKDGTLQPHLKVNRIEELRMPIVGEDVQEEISKLIKDSYVNFNESKEYLKESIDLFDLIY
jgi:restriction endonuclease S subunit